MGSGVLADALAKHLAAPEVEVLRTRRDQIFEAIAPNAAHLVVLVGDAAAERGTPLINETLKRLGAGAPLMVVVTAPQIGGLSPQPMSPGAACLTPEGGMVECARRLRVMLERLSQGALEHSSLQQVADETSRKATEASAVPAPATAGGPGPARPRQNTLLGQAGQAPRPVSTKIEVRTHDVPGAISGATSRSVSAIAAVVPKASSAEPGQSVEMMWGEATPTVVARTRSRPPSANLDLRPGDVGLGQAPLSLSALAGAGGAVGVEVRIRTASKQSMPKVVVPAPSGSLPPTAAAPIEASRVESSTQSTATLRSVAQAEPETSAAAKTFSAPAPQELQPPAAKQTAVQAEVSLASLEPPEVAFSEAPSTSASPEAPTPVAISIPASAEPAARPRQRRSAARYVMAAALVLALAGGAAAAFKLMRPSEATQASAPVTPFGALAQADPARQSERSTTVVGTAKPEGLEPSAAPPEQQRPSGADSQAPSAQPTAAPSDAVPANAAAPQDTVTVSNEAPAAPVEPASNANAAPAVQPAAVLPKADLAAEPSAPDEPAALEEQVDYDDHYADEEVEDPRHDAPAPNPAAIRAARLVDEGLALAKQGRLGLAEAAHLRALKVFPNYPRALAGLVRVHLARKDGSEAVRWAKRLTKRQPSRAHNQLLLGDAQAVRGDRKAARKAWLKAAKSGSAAARSRLKSTKRKA